jgi:hypothetical protein
MTSEVIENITGDNGGQDIGYPYGTGAQKKEQQFQKKIPTLHTTSVSGGDTLPAHAHNNKKKQTFIGPTLEHTQGPSLNIIQILKQFKKTAPKRTCFFYIFSF